MTASIDDYQPATGDFQIVEERQTWRILDDWLYRQAVVREACGRLAVYLIPDRALNA